MKKDVKPSENIRKKRLKKKLKRYNPRIYNISLKKRKIRTKKKINHHGFISMENSFICDEFLSSNTHGSFPKRKRNVKISIPKNFDIFKNTEVVIEKVIEITKQLMMPGLSHIEVDHTKVVNTSLGSESLFGLLITEILSNRRSQRSEKISIFGTLPSSGTSARMLIDNVGVVKELEDDHFTDAQDNKHNERVHYYRKDNKYAVNTSIKGDNKSLTAEEFVNYIDSCLNSHKLKLSDPAKSKFKACLGEVFDNAEEHCGRNKPVWFVRGYFHDVEDDRFLELAVFNLGNSFYDNFSALPEDSNIKSVVSKYVDRHKTETDVKSLFTVIALQGSVSTKRDIDPTRGHGSVTLIETFESMYDEYKKLRVEKVNETNAEMNIISGETIIKFDGKYRSKTSTFENGQEKFIMAFNADQDLNAPPEPENVYTMNNVRFPGVMINIRIPLKGSTVPLRGGK